MTVIGWTALFLMVIFSIFAFIVLKVVDMQDAEEKKAKLDLQEERSSIQENEFAQFVHSLTSEQRLLLRKMLKL